MPAVARREGITAVFAPSGTAPEVVTDLGEVVIVDTEDVLDALSTATSTIAAHLEYLATIAGWLGAHGVAADLAGAYVWRTFDALPTDVSLPTAAADHATPVASTNSSRPS